MLAAIVDPEGESGRVRAMAGLLLIGLPATHISRDGDRHGEYKGAVYGHLPDLPRNRNEDKHRYINSRRDAR